MLKMASLLTDSIDLVFHLLVSLQSVSISSKTRGFLMIRPGKLQLLQKAYETSSLNSH
jgi:hypothetical protein